MYLNNAYSCCFTEHSEVTAHNRDRQISYIRETTGVSRKAPRGSELGDRRQSTWLSSQIGQSLKASPLKTKKQNQLKILLHIYIYIHKATLPSGPHPESITRSPLIGWKKVSTRLSSVGVRRQLSSVVLTATCEGGTHIFTHHDTWTSADPR